MNTTRVERSVLLRGTEPEQFTPHAAARWARIVAGVLTSPVDLRTLEEWGRHIAASRGALKTWCGLAGASPRRSLLLGRMLRAVRYRRRGARLENCLDIRDRRTLRKLVEAAGHPAATDDLRDVVMKQHLIENAELIAALVRALDEHEGASGPSWHPHVALASQPRDVSARPS